MSPQPDSPTPQAAPSAPPNDQAASPSPPSDQVLGPTWRQRLRRSRPVVLALLLVAVVTFLTTSTTPAGSKVPLALDNAHPDGARALGEVLRSYGVRPHAVHTLAEAQELLRQDPTSTTLALVGVGSLSPQERQELARLGADVTVLGTIYEDLTGLTPLQASGLSAPSQQQLTPSCADADAQAATTLEGSRGAVTIPVDDSAPAGTTGCFPVATGYAYATTTLSGGGTLRVIGDASIARNSSLTRAGNAALLVRTLGHKPYVVWFDAAHPQAPSIWETPSLPRWAPLLLAVLVAAAAVLALADGRRMGRLVREDLPVEVPAAETTVGLGRMYQSSRDRAHAAHALRVGTALRLGHRLGLHPSAEGGVLLDELARRAGPQQGPQLRESAGRLLYGPPPGNDQELTALAAQLDRLESEVQNR